MRTRSTAPAGAIGWLIVGPPGSAVNNAKPVCADFGRTVADVNGVYTITISGQGDAVGDYRFSVEHG